MKNRYQYITGFALLLLFACVPLASAAAPDKPMSAEELDAWFNSDEDVVDPIKLINEGDLVFLKQEPERKPHEAHHAITILPDSIVNGWVGLSQCHDNLDMMPAAQVVFINKRVRKLKVLSSKNIEKVWVEGDTVQMKKIGRDARLCIALETRALWKNTDGSYSLRTGPYQRKFLDGYFPMRLMLDLTYPRDVLMFKSLMPAVQPGISMLDKGGLIHINALFEGKLHLVVNFIEK